MTLPSSENMKCRVGLHILQLLRDQQDLCDAETMRKIFALPAGLAACLVQLGTLQSLLNRAAS